MKSDDPFEPQGGTDTDDSESESESSTEEETEESEQPVSTERYVRPPGSGGGGGDDQNDESDGGADDSGDEQTGSDGTTDGRPGGPPGDHIRPPGGGGGDSGDGGGDSGDGGDVDSPDTPDDGGDQDDGNDEVDVPVEPAPGGGGNSGDSNTGSGGGEPEETVADRLASLKQRHGGVSDVSMQDGGDDYSVECEFDDGETITIEASQTGGRTINATIDGLAQQFNVPSDVKNQLKDRITDLEQQVERSFDVDLDVLCRTVPQAKDERLVELGTDTTLRQMNEGDADTGGLQIGSALADYDPDKGRAQAAASGSIAGLQKWAYAHVGRTFEVDGEGSEFAEIEVVGHYEGGRSAFVGAHSSVDITIGLKRLDGSDVEELDDTTVYEGSGAILDWHTFESDFEEQVAAELEAGGVYYVYLRTETKATADNVFVVPSMAAADTHKSGHLDGYVSIDHVEVDWK